MLDQWSYKELAHSDFAMRRSGLYMPLDLTYINLLLFYKLPMSHTI